MLLSWFVDEAVATSAIDGILIEEDAVECRPDYVSNSILDENVDIFLIRKYFSTDAWMIVEDVLDHKKNHVVWVCKACSHDLHSEPSVICEACICLTWFHFRCVGLTSRPKKTNWFCRSCH